jgi:hypothetical protein
MEHELSPLAPTTFELVFTLGAVTALLFAVYAVYKVRRGDWAFGAGLTLAVITFIIPFSGPLLVAALTWRRHLRARRSPAAA